MPRLMKLLGANNMVKLLRLDEVYAMLTEIYPNRTVIIGIELKSHVVYGVRRKPYMEISVWIGDDIDVDGDRVAKSELKNFLIN